MCYLVDEELKASVGQLERRVALDAVKDLRERIGDVTNGARLVACAREQVDLTLAGVVVAVLVEEGVDGGRRYATEDERLPIEARVAVEERVADARKVRLVALLRLHVHVLEYARHVLPVLHHQHVRVVHYEQLYGGQEVVVSILTITRQNHESIRCSS